MELISAFCCVLECFAKLYLVLKCMITMCRADTVYRLCYSSLIIHWRSYMMFTRDSLFKSLFSFDEVFTGHWSLVVTIQCMSPAQECVVMCQTLSMLLAGSRIYEAASVLIRWGANIFSSSLSSVILAPSRYWFVKSSLRTEVMETFKRDQFVYKVLLFPQVIVNC